MIDAYLRSAMHFIEILWWLTITILTGYHLLIFRVRRMTAIPAIDMVSPGVSIVIAVRNDSDRLIRNLQAMLVQQYPDYEIIIIDDHSRPEECEKLERTLAAISEVRLYRNTGAPGKKQALLTGVDMARNELILCTDADCRPAAAHWVNSMVESSAGADMILGYSPYRKESGWLNLFIRIETVLTGMQYLSWAMAGKAYMGVGRNLMYRRSLFLHRRPYAQHTIPYGDDDLWVQQAASEVVVGVCIKPESFVYSDSATSWPAWWRQKHRHLSAAHEYTPCAWLRPGVYGLALILHWILWGCMLLTLRVDLLMAIAFVGGLLIRWQVYAGWTLLLGDRDTTKMYPLAEPVYALYLSVAGLLSLVSKKKAWN